MLKPMRFLTASDGGNAVLAKGPSCGRSLVKCTFGISTFMIHNNKTDP